MATFPGVGPDAPIETKPSGFQQSQNGYRFDLIPPEAMFTLARVLDYGAKRYPENNWQGLETKDHLNSVIMHVYAYMGGDTQDDHLGHALTRAVFALWSAMNKDGYVPLQGDEVGPRPPNTALVPPLSPLLGGSVSYPMGAAHPDEVGTPKAQLTLTPTDGGLPASANDTAGGEQVGSEP